MKKRERMTKKYYYPYGIIYDQERDVFFGQHDIYSQAISYPISVVFNTSHECNLFCPYCFRIGSDIPPQTYQEIMSDLKHLPVSKPLRLVLSGGEPFWRKDIYKVISFCAMQPWNVVIVTNGTYQIDFFNIPKDFLLEFSLDAPNPDVYKKTRGGSEGNYKTLVRNIEKAVLLGYRVRPCYLMSRINTTDEILREIINFSHKLGVKEIRLQRFKPWGEGEKLSTLYEFSQTEYIEICSKAVEYAQQLGLGIRVPQNNRFLAIGSVYVLPDGRVTLQVDDSKEQKILGTLRKNNLEKIWRPYKKIWSTIHLQWLIGPKRII